MLPLVAKIELRAQNRDGWSRREKQREDERDEASRHVGHFRGCWNDGKKWKFHSRQQRNDTRTRRWKNNSTRYRTASSSVSNRSSFFLRRFSHHGRSTSVREFPLRLRIKNNSNAFGNFSRRTALASLTRFPVLVIFSSFTLFRVNAELSQTRRKRIMLLSRDI